MKTQKEIWNSIAPEWDEYKQIPSKLSQEFLRSASGKILDFGLTERQLEMQVA